MSKLSVFANGESNSVIFRLLNFKMKSASPPGKAVAASSAPPAEV